MHRIDTATKAADLFGAGKDGFKNGAKVSGIPATDLTAEFFNDVQENLCGVIEASGIALTKGDASQLAKAIQSGKLFSASAGGTTDAITASFGPAVATLVNGMALFVRAGLANATTTPTFKADGTTAKTIVKGAGSALVAGDIAGGGHWIELQYDLTLDKWVLLNPANGVNTSGRLLNIQKFTANGTYTPTPGMAFAVVEVQGGGASGGGASLPSIGNVTLGSPGTSGSYGKGKFTAAAIGGSQVITVGVGGAAASGGSGNAGGTSSFGALLSSPGGVAGGIAANQVPPFVSGNGTSSSSPSGANILGSVGATTSASIAISAASAMGGPGGGSLFGPGGQASAINTVGVAANNPGSGGSGCVINNGYGGGAAGGAGAAGIVIIYEYA